MDLKDILSISGQPGLYKMVSQGKNAIIVENLDTGKRMPAHARHRISALEDIAMFTNTEDKPLKEILQEIFKKEDGKALDDPKKMSNADLKKYFEEIVPDYDQERVYPSDMKKALEWYNILLGKGLIDLVEEEPVPDKESDTAEKEQATEDAE